MDLNRSEKNILQNCLLSPQFDLERDKKRYFK